MKLRERLQLFLNRQKERACYRHLSYKGELVDFSSNDYLGLARNPQLQSTLIAALTDLKQYGATGSRLLSGQHPLMEELEQQLAQFHNAETALLFNSGYHANISFLSTIPRRGDLIIFDELVHASMHDGMRLGKANTIAFKHNNIDDLKAKLAAKKEGQICFVLIESIYSMDGDITPLEAIVECCACYDAYIMIDEAHATGVLGSKGAGLVQTLGLEDRIFARLHTFGKAIGGHGAVLLGGKLMRNYMINFARPFIFSTAMSLASVLHAQKAYKLLEKHGTDWVNILMNKVSFFRHQMKAHPSLVNSQTPIQAFMIAGNEKVVAAANTLAEKGFDVRPIRMPTVAVGQERLRICIHLSNTEEELALLAKNLLNL